MHNFEFWILAPFHTIGLFSLPFRPALSVGSKVPVLDAQGFRFQNLARELIGGSLQTL